MKRIILLLTALASLLSAPVFAQSQVRVVGRASDGIDRPILATLDGGILTGRLDATAVTTTPVAANSTVLFTADTTGYGGVAVQITGTFVGTVSFQYSDDGTNYTTAFVQRNLDSGFVSSTTAVGTFFVSAQHRYFRAITTAYTSGTINSTVYLRMITVDASGASVILGAGASAIGDVGVQYRGNATGAATIAAVMSPATPVATAAKASAGRLLGMVLTNSSAGVRSVKFWNIAVGSVTLGTTAALFEIDIQPGQTIEFNMEGGMSFATAITYTITGAKGLTDNTAVTLNDVSGVLFYS